MPHTKSPARQSQKREPLRRLRELLVLGGRYWFGRGTTKFGEPLLYISIPGRPGISILAGNLAAFQKMFNEVCTEFSLTETDGPGALKPIAVTIPSCLGPQDKPWIKRRKEETAKKFWSDFDPHPFVAEKDGEGELTKVCKTCGYLQP